MWFLIARVSLVCWAQTEGVPGEVTLLLVVVLEVVFLRWSVVCSHFVLVVVMVAWVFWVPVVDAPVG